MSAIDELRRFKQAGLTSTVFIADDAILELVSQTNAQDRVLNYHGMLINDLQRELSSPESLFNQRMGGLAGRIANLEAKVKALEHAKSSIPIKGDAKIGPLSNHGVLVQDEEELVEKYHRLLDEYRINVPDRNIEIADYRLRDILRQFLKEARG